jgi:putative phosphoribosyl transferase
MGAIASGGVRVVNWTVLETLGISAEEIERIAAEEQRELERREREYRDGRPRGGL